MRRHDSDWFETTADERADLTALADEARAALMKDLGVNVGVVAGQTIFQVHLHLIPRYAGDVADPRGGGRGVTPAKQSY